MIKSALSESRVFLISLVIAVIIFIIDSSTPSGYAGSFLYILPVFICLWAMRDRTVYWMAIIATILTILAVPFQPVQDPAADLFNRPIAIIGIWIVVILGVQRRKAEREAQEYARDLIGSHSDLKQLTYVVSHDLQEPLNTVVGDLTILEQNYRDKLDPDATERIHHAMDSGKRMSDLIRDLLDYSSIDATSTKFAPVDMNEVVAKTLKTLEESIRENEAEVQVDELPTIMADEGQMARVMRNLVDNAIRYRGKERPKVHINCADDPEEYIFSVKDNGIGLDMKYADRIFHMLQRLHTREEYEGTGIGLAICRKIVERHGGRIWVDSIEGEGSTFFFSIPF